MLLGDPLSACMLTIPVILYVIGKCYCVVFERPAFSTGEPYPDDAYMFLQLQYGGFFDSSSSSPTSTAAAAAAAHSTGLQKATAKSSAAAASVPMVSIPQGHGDLCDIPASLVFPLSVMKFRGVPVRVPGDVPGVLRYRYGDTFMIPR